MLWTKVKSEAARGDGGRGFAGLPRVVSDELKEASEQGGAAIWAERGGGQRGGSRVDGRHRAWIREGIRRELRVYWVSVVTGAAVGRLSSE